VYLLMLFPMLVLWLADAVTPTTVSAGQALALTIAGAVSFGVTYALKHFFSADGKGAVVLTVAVSAVVSVVALLISGDENMKLLFSGNFSNIGNLYAAALSVFGVATAVYKLLWLKKSEA
jgi:EamA domain-containing membrane protein RarD